MKLRAEIFSRQSKSLILQFCLLGQVLGTSMSFRTMKMDYKIPHHFSFHTLKGQVSILCFASLTAMFCASILKTELNYATSNKLTYKILSEDIFIGKGRTEYCTQGTSGRSEGRKFRVETLHVFGNMLWCIFES